MRARFVNESDNIGANSSWTRTYKDKEITITLKDVNKYLDEKSIKVIEINPNKLKHLLIDTKRDPNRVQKADLDYPIIVVKNDEKYTNILDGQHRVLKCLTNKIDKIKAKVLELNNAPPKYKFMFK